MHPFVESLVGGLLIGLSSWLLLLSLGRVAGISGIAGGLMTSPSPTRADAWWRLAFLLGLIGTGALTMWLVPGALPDAPTLPQRPLGLLIAAGLLVGYGTVTGSGCTSGHGVCGLGRRSGRSLAATAVFMGFGVATVTLVRHVLA